MFVGRAISTSRPDQRETGWSLPDRLSVHQQSYWIQGILAAQLLCRSEKFLSYNLSLVSNCNCRRQPVSTASTLPRPFSARIALLALIMLVNLAGAARANGQVVRIADNPSKAAISDDDRAKARDIFAQRCATCHGADGHGNGPAAANLKPKPIDFHSQNWQKSVTDATMTNAIVFGGRSVGKSGQMAPNPDLEDEPEIVAALVERIRKWGK